MRRQFQSHPVGNYNPMRAKKAVRNDLNRVSPHPHQAEDDLLIVGGGDEAPF